MMTYFRFASVLLAVACSVQTAWAVDLDKIDRTIAKEPKYQAAYQEYCLLVFGRHAKTRVWLVRDGDAFYVDRNGNGDLTEADEKFDINYRANAGTANQRFSLDFGPIKEKDGTATVRVNVISWGHRKEGEWHVHARVKGRWASYNDVDDPIVTTRVAKSAPIVHLNGPLSVVPFKDWTSTPLKRGESRKLNLIVGNRGYCEGPAVIHESGELSRLLHGSTVEGRLEFVGEDGAPRVITQRWIKGGS